MAAIFHGDNATLIGGVLAWLLGLVILAVYAKAFWNDVGRRR
jgi:hypothetical protein